MQITHWARAKYKQVSTTLNAISHILFINLVKSRKLDLPFFLKDKGLSLCPRKMSRSVFTDDTDICSSRLESVMRVL